MIQIKPNIDHQSSCPSCGALLSHRELVWQGIHVCINAECPNCAAKIVEDLKVGQAIYTPYQVDVAKNQIWGDTEALPWFGHPLLESLRSPDYTYDPELLIEKKQSVKNVVILNCIDFLYGHSLLKLLNSEQYLKNPEIGLIVIVPAFLRWMVPEGVSEIWTVDIPLSKALKFYPALDKKIKAQLVRFENIYLSLAYSHPADFNISNFSGVDKHDIESKDFRITFVWREDRLWWGNEPTLKIMKKLNWYRPALHWQTRKIVNLFGRLRKVFPRAKYTVAGFGIHTKFPSWIEDLRVDKFTPFLEKKSCEIYSESRLVIGVHGSNMLLPSAHAGMTIDLLPRDRWGNFAQDLLYQYIEKNEDPRIISWRYRYYPIEIQCKLLALISGSMLKNCKNAQQIFLYK